MDERIGFVPFGGRYDTEDNQEIVLPLVAFLIGLNLFAFSSRPDEGLRTITGVVDGLVGLGVIIWAMRREGREEE